MAVKRPLCIYGTEQKQLELTDTLPDALMPGAEGMFRNGSGAGQLQNVTTEIVLAGTNVVVPAGTIAGGTAITLVLYFLTTTTGTGTLTLRIRGGTTGTIADALIATVALPAATAGTPSGRFDLALNIRGPGASATSYGHALLAKTAANGVGGNVASSHIVMTPATFNSAPITNIQCTAQLSATTPALTWQTTSMELLI